METQIDTAARGWTEGKWRERNPLRICGVIIHTTGAGPWRRWKTGARTRDGHAFESPFEAAEFIFSRIVTTGPHFLVCGDTGDWIRMAPDTAVAWHTGSKGAWKYRLPGWRALRDVTAWTNRWPELKSPRDFLDGNAWRHGSANQLTIGIEVAPPKEGPRQPWSDATWETLARIAHRSADEYEFPVDRYHVLSHSDIHPHARISKTGRLWDPGARQWPGPTEVMRRLDDAWVNR